MRLVSRALVVPICCALALSALVVAEIVMRADPAVAQISGGEFELRQPGGFGPVGWVRVNGDRSVEWWAYVRDTYRWADSASTPTSPWHLEARYVGPGDWATYPNWKADVLQRAAAQGHTIVFQDHSVAEVCVDN